MIQKQKTFNSFERSDTDNQNLQNQTTLVAPPPKIPAYNLPINARNTEKVNLRKARFKAFRQVLLEARDGP